MTTTYSLNDFNRYLKLGIWHSGKVDFWGYVESISPKNDYLLNEDLCKRYDSSSLIKRHLGVGVYLLDIFHAFSNTISQSNTYHLVIAVCRNDMKHLEKVYCVRITNGLPVNSFYSALSDPTLPLEQYRKRRRSPILDYRGSKRSLSGNIPIGSRYIHHR